MLSDTAAGELLKDTWKKQDVKNYNSKEIYKLFYKDLNISAWYKLHGFNTKWVCKTWMPW